MRAPLLSVLAGLAPLAGVGAAQSFNVDVADLAGVPSDAYGAAAAQPGRWNALTGGPPYAATLVDLTGALTGVTTQVTAVGNGSGDYTADNPGTSGDDQALMDDLQDVGNGATTPPASTRWTFSGLPDVAYDVYVYAWAPDSTTFISFVSECGSTTSAQVSGGWPGGHVEGVTYALVTAVPQGGVLELCIDSGGLPANFSSVNGFQLVEGLPPPPGAPACFGDGSGALCGCGNEVPPGTESGCANGTGLGAALTGQGAASLSGDTLVLEASGLPAQPGLFFQGNGLVNGGAGVSFGDGLRCCGQALLRLEVVTGQPPEPASVSSSVTISQHPGQALAPGDTRCYQLWYRDPLASPCGASSFNFSNAYVVTWLP